MNDKDLFNKQQAVKYEFDTLSAKKAQKDTELEELTTELARLQGEWRMIDKLRKELNAGKVDPTVATVDPAPEKSDKKLVKK